ncbi:peptide deformylase [Legionella oakridgensis]|uniref:Peptide deformylase n=2 Tax=Legionella oakridgensis TaxID=29423 RepID=W0BI19_9GAMM|nr:peptide deformylase [Legionella oakridgensis]AHE68331.1 peptide deformylase [Legionella oakridgensis ATCC 33761 = DSM 21215]ETO92194.1 peptide deformylase [Legionella oakridgensis RV-2-2007]KTD38997.1 polypeptide deformylase [Legionella oakridgensis]STY21275.1 polypeptide deformylase [Legionella longbeachae]
MIPHLNIVTIEQPGASSILKAKSGCVSFPLDAENRALIFAMKDKLQQLGGVGLAAPQVGYNKNIIAIYIPKEAALLREHVTPYPMHILINPSYEVWRNSATVHDFEGCYSVTSKAGKVPRYHTIRLTYQDESGQSHTTKESGFYARVLQHEIDHLNGLLITDRLTPECLQGSVEDMMAIRRKELTPAQQEQFDKLMQRKFNKT